MSYLVPGDGIFSLLGTTAKCSHIFLLIVALPICCKECILLAQIKPWMVRCIVPSIYLTCVVPCVVPCVVRCIVLCAVLCVVLCVLPPCAIPCVLPVAPLQDWMFGCLALPGTVGAVLGALGTGHESAKFAEFG